MRLPYIPRPAAFLLAVALFIMSVLTDINFGYNTGGKLAATALVLLAFAFLLAALPSGTKYDKDDDV